MDLFIQQSRIQILFIGLFLLIKEYCLACNFTAVNECTTVLSQAADSNVTIDGISAIPDVDQLAKLCGAMPEFSACYGPKAKECSNDLSFSMTFGTIENTVDYLCVDGYDAILEHASCWNQTGVTTDTTHCHMEQNQMISELHSQQMLGNLDSTLTRSLWCQILDNTTTCMQNAVWTRCGEEAGCIMRTMMMRALKGLAALMKCTAHYIPAEPCSTQTHNNDTIHTDGTVHTSGDNHSNNSSNTVHTDGTINTDGDQHSDHSNNSGNTVHTDGSVHADGDQHSDHSNDHGHADPEISTDPDNGANTLFLHHFTYVLSIYLSCRSIAFF